MIENELSNKILGACIKIHKCLGPGLLESVYESILYYELTNNLNFNIYKQMGIPVIYEDVILDIGFRADLIIEIKSVENIHDVYKNRF